MSTASAASSQTGIDNKAADTTNRRRPLRVAFISPAALHDPASGAAQSLMTLLRSLSRAGVQCSTLTGSCFDAPHGEALSQFLATRDLHPKGRLKGSGLTIWEGNSAGISQVMIQVPSQRRMSMTAVEEASFRDIANDLLKRIKPDIVITFGGLLLDIEIHRLAQRAGAAVVFYLANPKYNRPETFENVNLILTNSDSTAALYAERLGLHCINIGLFVDPEPVIAPVRTPEYVTFINPQPEKGVTLFLRLVERAARECPEMRFLVVESRTTLAPAIKKMKLPQSILSRITLMPRQEDMREVYRQTRILLMPSFWFEAAGRVLIEANANGIPVIATNRGGIPETLAGGGILLDIPETCTKNHWHVPNDAELDPWWSALQPLWTDDAHYLEHSEKALQASAKQSLGVKTKRVLSLFQRAAVQRQSEIQQAKKKKS